MPEFCLSSKLPSPPALSNKVKKLFVLPFWYRKLSSAKMPSWSILAPLAEKVFCVLLSKPVLFFNYKMELWGTWQTQGRGKGTGEPNKERITPLHTGHCGKESRSPQASLASATTHAQDAVGHWSGPFPLSQIPAGTKKSPSRGPKDGKRRIRGNHIGVVVPEGTGKARAGGLAISTRERAQTPWHRGRTALKVKKRC